MPDTLTRLELDAGTSLDQIAPLRSAIDQLLSRWAESTGQQRSDVKRQLQAKLDDSTIPVAGDTLEDYIRDWLEPFILSASANADPCNLSNMTSVPLVWCSEFSRLCTLLNQNVVSAKSAGAFGDCEAFVLKRLYEIVFRHPCESDLVPGMLTSGGSTANLSSLWIARNNGPSKLKSVILGSKLMHYSIVKSADILGLGKDAIRFVPTDKDYRCDISALKNQVWQSERSGESILAIVGVAGTTEVGSIDPLSEMGQLAAELGSWFHVDATWVGGALFSETYRDRLAGLELADSLAMDCHKQMFLPVAQALVLLKDAQSQQAIRHTAEYLFHDHNDRGLHAVDGSRDASVLLLHAALHLLGRDGYARIATKTLATAERFAQQVKDSDCFQLLTEPQSNLVAYRFRPPTRQLSSSELDQLNEQVYHRQVREGRGRVSLSRMPIGPETSKSSIFRAVFSNPQTAHEHASIVLKEQQQYGYEAMDHD